MTGFRPVFGLLVLMLGSGSVSSQSRIDLRTQSKSIDFSGAPSTKPSKTGTTLPATCGVGDLFFKSDAPAGANLYGCTAVNTWSLLGDISHTHAAGGDVAGELTALTVARIQNRPVASTAPTGGQVLGWNATTSQWEPQAASSGGGASTASQLGDLAAAYVNSTQLRIGAQCTASSPCNVRIGGTVHAFTASAVATLSAGTGTAYFYVSKDGVLTVGHNLTVSCAGCVQEPATSFPSGSVPLFTWTATNGAWDASGGTDWRAFLSNHPVTVGTGLVGVDAGGQTLVSVNTAVVGLRVAVPASAAGSCTAGSWAADSTYYYICYQDNAWGRVALSSW